MARILQALADAKFLDYPQFFLLVANWAGLFEEEEEEDKPDPVQTAPEAPPRKTRVASHHTSTPSERGILHLQVREAVSPFAGRGGACNCRLC
jgi:hypothetical protein